MNKLITILFSIIPITSYAQTPYYTTDGKNRMTEAEVQAELTKRVDATSKAFGQQLSGELEIESTETKADSLIHTVKFKFISSDAEGFTSFSPLSELKDKHLPSFELKTLTNETFNSEQLKGKPTLINFWFTSCAPCVKEMPALNAIYEKHKDAFNFVAITHENQKAVEKFLSKRDFTFTHLVDARPYIDKLGVKAYPMNVFLDKNGVVKDTRLGIPQRQDEDGKITEGDGEKFVDILKSLK